MTDLGDSVRFERKIPFGISTWVSKKNELTDGEQAMLLREQLKNQGASKEVTPARGPGEAIVIFHRSCWRWLIAFVALPLIAQQPPAPAPAVPAAQQAPHAAQQAPPAAPQAPQAPAAPPTTTPQQPPPTVYGGLSLNNASLTEVIDLLARQLRINYILDPRVKGGVILNTYGETKDIDTRSLLETILRINGYGMVKQGELYRIVLLTEISHLPTTARD